MLVKWFFYLIMDSKCEKNNSHIVSHESFNELFSYDSIYDMFHWFNVILWFIILLGFELVPRKLKVGFD